MNLSAISGRIPFDMELRGSDDNLVLMFTTSVKRNYKKPEETYYPEDLITCKAFGNSAKFINQYFAKGSVINLVGEIRKDNDYEKDGVKKYGQLYFHVNQANFVPKGSDDVQTGGATKAPAAAKKANPLAAKPSPFVKK